MALAADEPSAREPSRRPDFGVDLATLAIRLLLLLAAGLVVLRFLVAPLDRFDEGVTVTKGAMVAAGWFPYHDFWVTHGYGPMDAFLLGTAFHVLGSTVLVERVFAIVLTLAFAVLAYALLTSFGLPPGMRALITGLMAMTPLSEPYFNTAILANVVGLATVFVFHRSLQTGSSRAAASAGILLGVISFVRPEFALALCLGLSTGYCAQRGWHRALRLLGPLLGAALATAATLWTPVLWVAGYRAVVADVVVYALKFYRAGRSIPLGQGHDGLAVVVFSLGFVAIWSWAIVHILRNRRRGPEAAFSIGVLLTAVLAFGWVVTRADGEHALYAWPLSAILLALLMADRLRFRRPSARLDRSMVFAGLLLLCLPAAALSLRDLSRPGGVAGLPRASLPLARSWLPAGQLQTLVGTIDAQVPAGQPIFVGLQQNDLVDFNDTMVYFLAARLPGTGYYEYFPGFTNQQPIEHVIACQLSRAHVRLAVLGPNTLGEPWNLSSKPGSSYLDQWLASHAVGRTWIGPYTVLQLSTSQQPMAPCAPLGTDLP